MACSLHTSPSVTPPGKRKQSNLSDTAVDLRSQSAIIHSWSEGKDMEGVHIVRCISKSMKDVHGDNHVAQLLELDEEITAIEAEIARIRKLKQDLKESSLPGHSSETFSPLADLEFSVDDQVSVEYPDLDLDVDVEIDDCEWSGYDSPSQLNCGIFASSEEEGSVALRERRKRPRRESAVPETHLVTKSHSDGIIRKRRLSKPLMSKVELVDTITHVLPSDKLSGVIDIVSESSVPLVTTDNDDIEFDISSIDEKTLSKLSDFVHDCLEEMDEPKRPKKKTRTKRKRVSNASLSRAVLSKTETSASHRAKGLDVRAIFKEEEVVRVNRSTEDELVEIC